MIKERKQIVEITASIKDRFNVCNKCGQLPKIYNIWKDNYIDGEIIKYEVESLICCPNEECQNIIKFNKSLLELYNIWNKQNPLKEN